MHELNDRRRSRKNNAKVLKATLAFFTIGGLAAAAAFLSGGQRPANASAVTSTSISTPTTISTTPPGLSSAVIQAINFPRQWEQPDDTGTAGFSSGQSGDS